MTRHLFHVENDGTTGACDCSQSMRIATLTEDQILLFREWVSSVDTDYTQVLRVAVDGDGVKLQSNGGVWSPGIGESNA